MGRASDKANEIFEALSEESRAGIFDFVVKLANAKVLPMDCVGYRRRCEFELADGSTFNIAVPTTKGQKVIDWIERTSPDDMERQLGLKPGTIRRDVA